MPDRARRVVIGLTILKSNIGQEAAMDVNELTDQERAILAFVKRHFERKNMRFALRMLDSARINDIRQIIDGYRGLYEREVRH
jgi:hypothetical protein